MKFLQRGIFVSKEYIGKKLLIITDVPFPYGFAMSSRLRSFCKLFSEVGYNVHVIVLYNSNQSLNAKTVYAEDGYTYEVVLGRKANTFDSFFANKKILLYIKQYLENNKVDLIFSTSAPLYFNKIAVLAKHKNIPYYVEQCEKYDITSYKLGEFDPRRLQFLKLYNKEYKKATGVVAISRFLENHYKSLNIPTIRIPTIVDVDNTKFNTNKNDSKIRLVLTGNIAGKKELIEPIVKALYNNPNFRQRICFDIFGTEKDKVIKDYVGIDKLLDDLQNVVIFNGRVPQEKISEIISNSDFQIFIRPDRESSHAGFPTKLGESMTVGTPVITNNTGDIPLYLKNGENGFLLEDETEKSVTKIFDKILNMSETDLINMRRNARKTAEKHFNYKTYIKEIDDFFNGI